MFSAQNGIFLQMENGISFLYFMRGFGKKQKKSNFPLKKTLVFVSLISEGELRRLSSEENRFNIIRKPKSFDMIRISAFLFSDEAVCYRGTEKAIMPALSGAMMPLFR